VRLNKKIELVIWEDAAGIQTTMAADEYCETITCSTVGFMIFKDKKLISISQDWQ